MYGTEWIAPAVGSMTQMGGQMAGAMYSAQQANVATKRARRYSRQMMKDQWRINRYGMEKAGFNPLLMLTGGAVHGGGGTAPVPGPVGEVPDFRGLAEDVGNIFGSADMRSRDKRAKDLDAELTGTQILKERWNASAAELSNSQIKANTALALADIEKTREETATLAHSRALMDAQAGSANARAALDRENARIRSKEGPSVDVIQDIWKDVGTVKEGARSTARDVLDQSIRAKELLTGERYDLKTPEGRERWRREHGGR